MLISLPLVNASLIDKPAPEEAFNIISEDGEEKELYTSWIENNKELCIKPNYESNLKDSLSIDKKGKKYDYKPLPLYIIDDKEEKILVGTIDFDKMKSDMIDKKKFCLKLNYKVSKEYHLGFNSIIAVISTTSWSPPVNQKIVYNSTGALHFIIKNSTSRGNHYVSYNNGSNWTMQPMNQVKIDTASLLVVDSTDNLSLFAYNGSVNRELVYTYKNATSNDWDFSTSLYRSNDTNFINQFNSVIDSNDVVHFCQVTSAWYTATTNGDFLMYFNWTKEQGISNTTNNSRKIWGNAAGNIGYPGEWINNDSTNDVDACDIEVDTNGSVYIAYTGTDRDNIAILSNKNNWAYNNALVVYDESVDMSQPPSLSIDPVTNMMWLVWAIPTGANRGTLRVANTTIDNWNINWTVRPILNDNDINELYVPFVKAINGSIIISGQVGNATNNRTVFIINSSNNFINYTFNLQLANANSSNSTSNIFPSLSGSNFPIFSRPRYNQIMVLNQIFRGGSSWVEVFPFDTYINYLQGESGGGGDTCTYTSGNWNINCGDNCTFSSSINLNRNNVTASGIGVLQGFRNVYNYSNRIRNGGCVAIR